MTIPAIPIWANDYEKKLKQVFVDANGKSADEMFTLSQEMWGK